ncbi:CYTH domain-containing protein [Orbaceae bacterium ESL0721]|nr:CYTH domain-containing protein [Orbaceae bacterium ESL0721]
MSQEIELKFAINSADIAPLTQFLMQYATPNHLILTNTYYDTADNYLRDHGYGLRVRKTEYKQNEHYEITLKRKGTMVAGLHERAEFNGDLPNKNPDLSQLPPNALPANCDLKQLQQSIIPLFQTDFSRQTWLVNIADSQIEVALDQGKIKTDSEACTIQELELELKYGSKGDLIDFALQLCRFHLRLFSQSKAARGYLLLQAKSQKLPSQKLPSQKMVESVPLTEHQSLKVKLSELLQYWQHNEESALMHNDLSNYVETFIKVAQRIQSLVTHLNDDDKLLIIQILKAIDLSAVTTATELAALSTPLKLRLMAHL